MDEMLSRVVQTFETRVARLNADRSTGSFRRLEVRVLGQQGLLIRRASLPDLGLAATTDFDAIIKEEPPLGGIFKNLLRDEGLTYDEQSGYIWLPEEVTYEVVYESPSIRIDSPLPIYLIVSKAVKAPEKNRQLVAAAIAEDEFGEQLLALLEKYEVDINAFI